MLPSPHTYRWSLKREFSSSTIFSSSSMSSLGRSAVMKALTVTETSSGSCVSLSAVCTTWSMSWRRYLFSGSSTKVQRSESLRPTRYRAWLLNREFSLHTCKDRREGNMTTNLKLPHSSLAYDMPKFSAKC